MKQRVCPWWLGFLLINPLRYLRQHPGRILKNYISEGMKVVDYGCGMGYFSLPMAELVGKSGKVICFDIQVKMIRSLLKRAEKRNLSDRIITRIIDSNNLQLIDKAGGIDFALLFAVLHELDEKEKLFSELYSVLKKGGKLLFAEPKGHVKKTDFENSLATALKAGFKISDNPEISLSHAALLIRDK